jgi:putative membrane protein
VKAFLVSLGLGWLLMLATAKLVPGIRFEGAVAALVASLALGLVNALVRPIVVWLTMPLTFLTLGLFLLVVNGLMFALTAWLVPGFTVESFGSALLGSLLLSVLNVIVPWLLVPDRDDD